MNEGDEEEGKENQERTRQKENSGTKRPCRMTLHCGDEAHYCSRPDGSGTIWLDL